MTRVIAISTGPHTHLDHLGVLAALFKIPLIVTDPSSYALAKTYYPQVDTVLKVPSELTLDYMAHHFDVIFYCGKFWATELLPFFELLYKKKMRFVFCPHGNSEKGFSLTSPIAQDIALVYGKHMLDHLQTAGALAHITATITTGNYRRYFYLKHQAFYNACAQERVSLDPSKQTILYAPTWPDRNTPSSFFDSCSPIIKQLSPVFNVIIKIHPLLEEIDPARTHHLLGHYHNYPHITFLTEFPPVYPLFELADLYLGDLSSMSYDFLTCDKPLFFLGRGNDRVRQCGISIPDSYLVEGLASFITDHCARNQTTHAKQRKELSNYAFGAEKEPEACYQELLKIF